MSKIKEIVKGTGLALMSAALPVMTAVAAGEDGEEAGAAGGSAVGNASKGLNDVNPGANTDLMGQIQLILNAVYVVVGIVAVIMIILGGISYATSQGDAAKVKKGKDTILYGIIGLVVVLLAFAITSFVLAQLG